MPGSPPFLPSLASMTMDHRQVSGSWPRDMHDDARGHAGLHGSLRGFRQQIASSPPSRASKFQHTIGGSQGISYPHGRSGGITSHTLPYTSHPTLTLSSQPPYHPIAGPKCATNGQVESRDPSSEPSYTSPKSLRKTKGHVASACVPCKRAHLRCDAQRPCSRCLSNGKEDACIDVQHKKRGRPRLRDDREARYDTQRLPHPHDDAVRRPSNVYSSDWSETSSDGYGSIHFQGSLPSANGIESFGQSKSYYRTQEAVAYLNLNMDIVNASQTFIETTGIFEFRGRNLLDVVSRSDLEKIYALRNQLSAEQKRKEPNYLPPILGRGDDLIYSLGFSVEDIARFRLDRQDHLNLVGNDGRSRSLPVSVGLAKAESFYFVVLVLNIDARAPYPSPSPRTREASLPYHQSHQTRNDHMDYAHHVGIGAHDHRHRPSEGFGHSRRPSGPPSHIPPGMAPGHSPRTPYSSISSRSDSIGSSHNSYRNDLPPNHRPQSHQSIQLPPLRGPELMFPPTIAAGRFRDDRLGRGGIERLLERPLGVGRTH